MECDEGKEIHKLVKDATDNVRPSKQSKELKSYIDYSSGLIIEGITNGIDSSRTYMAEQTSYQYNVFNGLADCKYLFFASLYTLANTLHRKSQ